MPLLSKKKKERTSTKGSASGGRGGNGAGSFSPPPPIPEQKRRRQADPSIVPAPPYLLASKFFDNACALPVIRNACPPDEDGGWRSALPDGWRDWSEFPTGRLSHSFSGFSFEEDLLPDLTFREFLDRRRGTGDGAGNATPGRGVFGQISDATPSEFFDFAFRTDTTTLCDLRHPLALATLLILSLILRTFRRACLPRFSALGRRLGRAAHGDGWEAENGDRIVKFGEYVYRLCYHSAVSAYGIWYFRDKSWWDYSQGGTANLWMGHPNQPVEPGMAWYYLVQGAYNFDALISLMELSLEVVPVNPFAYSSAIEFLEKEHVVDERQRKEQVFRMMARSRRRTVIWTPLFEVRWSPNVRGDFREMMAHHIVTNALILYSSAARLTRVGSMMFLIHDVSDVPVDMSKLANFVKWKVTTIVCFVIMVLTWMVTRLGVFPFLICRSVLTESHEYLVTGGTLDPASHDAYYGMFYLLLAGLAFLHMTWFLILLRIGWTLVRTGERHDFSEHKGGEKRKSS